VWRGKLSAIVGGYLPALPSSAGSDHGYAVREVCPEFPEHPAVIHWSVPDPSRTGATDEETYAAFVDTLAELEVRIRFFLARIDAEQEAAA